MRLQFFGDSCDIVKKSLIAWLSESDKSTESRRRLMADTVTVWFDAEIRA
jgi:hypothetical protein